MCFSGLRLTPVCYVKTRQNQNQKQKQNKFHQVYDVLDLQRFVVTSPSPTNLFRKSLIPTYAVKTCPVWTERMNTFSYIINPHPPVLHILLRSFNLEPLIPVFFFFSTSDYMTIIKPRILTRGHKRSLKSNSRVSSFWSFIASLRPRC